MSAILNLTQHAATAEQLAAGVLDLEPELRKRLQDLLTFESLPSGREVDQRAEQIAALAEPIHCRQAMIGGAPFLMARLEAALTDYSIQSLYAFSLRRSTEETLPDGSVAKVGTFRHLGWVPA